MDTSIKRCLAGMLCGFALLFVLLTGGLAPSEAAEADAETEAVPVRRVKLEPVRFDAPIPLTIFYAVELPLKVNARAPKTIRVGGRKLKAKPGGAPFPTTLEPGDIERQSVIVTADYYVCEDLPDALCWARKVVFEIPVAGQGAKVMKLDLTTPVFSTK